MRSDVQCSRMAHANRAAHAGTRPRHTSQPGGCGMLAAEAKKPLALRRVLEADTRTRTGDPFITRYGRRRPPNPIAARCLSRLRALASLPASRVCHPIRRDSVGLRAPGARSSVGNAETPLI